MAAGEKGPPDYSGLLKATITYDYLHTNSTTHEFVFGAIAELVDNSRDAGSKNLHIDYEESVGLSFLDDGCGMVPEEALKIVAFGHSLKRNETGNIGRYGNGLKSGALRLGKDFMVFTKKCNCATALMLSRSFHESKGITDVIVPAPQFDDNYEPMTTDTRKHKMEMELIFEYSPFKTEREFFEQFDKIKGESGTLVVLYNLRRIETGDLEMDFRTDLSDIGLTDVPPEREPEMNSLRAYLAILYLNPYTKIYLRGQKVNTIRILSTLADSYTYTKECSLKGANEKMIKEIQQEIRAAEEDLKKTKSDYGGALNSVKASSSSSALDVTNKTKLHNFALRSSTERLEEVRKREKELKRKNKPFPVQFSCGMNVHHRNRYGCMIYNNGRLIEMYVKLPIQRENNDIYMKCLGVVGVVDLPYEVLEPTHNKQSFESKRDYQVVMRAFNDCMQQFWEDRIVSIRRGPQDIKRYWTNFGYNDSSWSSECSQDMDFQHKRFQKTNHIVQCDACLKWRRIDYQKDYVLKGIPDKWECCNHPEPSQRNCTLPEHFGKLNPAKGRLKPQLKKPAAHAPTSLAGQKSLPFSLPSLSFKKVKSEEPSPVVATMTTRRYGAVNYTQTSSDDEEKSSAVSSPLKSSSSQRIPLQPTPRIACIAARRRQTPPQRKYRQLSSDEDDSSPATSTKRGNQSKSVLASVRKRSLPTNEAGEVPAKKTAVRNPRDYSDSDDEDTRAVKNIMKKMKVHRASLDSDEDEEPIEDSSGRRSSYSNQKDKEKSPSRRVVTDSEEEVHVEAPFQRAKTKADYRKVVEQRDRHWTAPASVPDQAEDSAVKTTPSSEDIKLSPNSMLKAVLKDPREENEQLKKRVAELEAQLKDAENANKHLRAAGMPQRMELLGVKDELAKEKAWRGQLLKFMEQLDIPANTNEVRKVAQAVENGRPDDVNWEEVAKLVFTMRSEQNVLLRESYPNDEKLVADMKAILNWVGSPEFKDGLDDSNCVGRFQELCGRIGSERKP